MEVKEIAIVFTLIGGIAGSLAWMDNRHVTRQEFEQRNTTSDTNSMEMGLSFRLSQCDVMIRLIEFQLQNSSLDDNKMLSLRDELSKWKALKWRYESVLLGFHDSNEEN